MDDESGSPESPACPICGGPLRRIFERARPALDCEQCGPFADFSDAVARARPPGSDRGPGEPGSDPTG